MEIRDTFGKVLKVTEIAIVDELASSAELVMGKTLGIPAAIIRGYEYEHQPSNLEILILLVYPLNLFSERKIRTYLEI